MVLFFAFFFSYAHPLFDVLRELTSLNICLYFGFYFNCDNLRMGSMLHMNVLPWDDMI